MPVTTTRKYGSTGKTRTQVLEAAAVVLERPVREMGGTAKAAEGERDAGDVGRLVWQGDAVRAQAALVGPVRYRSRSRDVLVFAGLVGRWLVRLSR